MPKIYPEEIKQKAIELRKQGFTYTEIPKLLDRRIPKSTFNSWFKNILLSEEAKERIINRIKMGGNKGRPFAWKKTRQKRIELLRKIRLRVKNEFHSISQLDKKIILAMLYLGEGGKTNEFIRLGNSSAKVIDLFITLLRQSFDLDESKFRGKLQCRADQPVQELEKYWSEVSKIPLCQFQKVQIDLRTVGIPTKRLDYKGVFVIEYHSNSVFFEVMLISDIIYSLVKGP